MKRLLLFVIIMFSGIALADSITFDLRDSSIEDVDEVNSFNLTQNGLTATLTALPMTFNEPPVRDLLLNRTASSFGVNVADTTCNDKEDSAQLDGGCTQESIQFLFDKDVYLNSVSVSSFGSLDVGLVTIGALTIDILSTDGHSLGNTFLSAGSPWSIAYASGNGFSVYNFTVTPTPEPSALLLLGRGLEDWS